MIMECEATFCKVYAEFQSIVTKLEAAAEKNEPIHEVEQSLVEDLRALGRSLLEAFIERQGDGDVGETVEHEEKTLKRLPDAVHERYFSAFGPIWIDHSGYATRPTQKVELKPLAVKLALPESGYSYVLERWDGILGVNNSYAEVSGQLEELLGICQSTRSLTRIVSGMGAHARRFQATQPKPPPRSEGELLVVTSDCKGVPMRQSAGEKKPRKKRLSKGEKNGTKRMACVGGIYTIERFERSVDDVLDDIRRKKRQGDRPQPRNKRLRANLTREVNGRVVNAKDATFGWLRHEGDQRNPRGKKTVVCIMDGEAKLWKKQEEMFPEAIGVLDIFHVMEHLWPCVHRFEAENTPEAARLFETKFRAILEGRIGRVIGAFRQMAVKRKLKKASLKTLESHLVYFENNRDRMKYDEYLEQGLPIGSGVVEGACRNLVKDRMERTGMRWQPSGAQAILDLRAVYLNGDWNEFHNERIRHEQNRLYPNRTQQITSP